jgi:putative sterol carrier protein
MPACDNRHDVRGIYPALLAAMAREHDMAASYSVNDVLQSFASRVREHPGSLGSHTIRLTIHGEGGGVWTLRTGDGEVSLVPGEGDGAPTVEVAAEAEALVPVLSGDVDGRAAFLAGGIRVRGDVGAIQQFSAALGTHQPRRAGGGGAGG